MNIRLAGHESFYPRQQWLYKGLSAVENQSVEFENKDSHPTDQLGVGINMVKSILFWLQGFGLVEKQAPARDGSLFYPYVLTKTGRRIWYRDTEMNRKSTIWILHHFLAANQNVTTWHWFFCLSSLVSFTEEQFNKRFLEFIETESNQNYSIRSIKNDFQVLTRMYQLEDDGKEDRFYPSLFATLDLIHYHRHQHRYVRNFTPDVPAEVFLYTLMNMIQSIYKEPTDVDLDQLKHMPGSPFATYGITVDEFFDLYEQLPQKIHKKVQLSRTSGIKTITYKPVSEEELLDLVYEKEPGGHLLY